MTKNLFITGSMDNNYVKCPKSTQPVSVVLGCLRCEDYRGGGVLDYKNKTIAGNCHVNCSLLEEYSSIQMEMELEAK